MQFKDVVELYIKLNVSNEYTSRQLRYIAVTFDERTNGCSVSDIDIETLIDFREKTLSAVKAVTYNGYLKYLRMVGRFCVDRGHWKENLFQLLKLEAEPEQVNKAIKLSDLQTVLQFLDDNQDRFTPHWFWATVIRFLYHTGMRRRQIVMLDWQDIDFKKKKVRCRAEGSKTKREWDIPLDQRLIPYLYQYKKLYQVATGKTLRPDDPVFNICRLNERYSPNRIDPDRMQPEQLTGAFKRIRKAAGIQRFSPHKLRHTTATSLCNPQDGSRPDIFTAQRILGHTTISTTRGYVHTSPERMRSELSAMPDL